MHSMNELEARWQRITQHIEKLQQNSLLGGRKVTLIAVSKGQPSQKIEQLLIAGQRVFGENRLQEAETRWAKQDALYNEVELHFIGTLQSNKIKEVLNQFDALHTLDRKKLVDSIAQERKIQTAHRCKTFFVQVNTGQEPQKGGVIPAEVAEFLQYCASHGLAISGLMCIPPAGEPPAPHFALLANMARKYGLAYLSMGMSEDYETAIRLGATHVRVGTALFGQREPV